MQTSDEEIKSVAVGVRPRRRDLFEECEPPGTRDTHKDSLVGVPEESAQKASMSAVDPAQLVGITDNPDLDSISEGVSNRFGRVLDSL